MSMQRIFSEEEMAERAKFTLFMQTYFIYHRKHTTSFKYPLSTDMIYDLYKKIYPITLLSAADLELYFNINGLIQSSGDVFLNLRAEKLSDMPTDLFKGLEAHLTTEIRHSLGTIPSSRISSDASVNVFREFVRLFVRTTRTEERTTTRRMYDLLTKYCMSHDLPLISSKAMATEIRRDISPVERGYADSKSGVNYAHCMIPTDADWELSLRLGLGVFRYNDKEFDNRGARLVLSQDELLLPDAATALYINNRIIGGHAGDESRTTETSGAEDRSTIRYLNEYRRAAKAKEKVIQAREAEPESDADNNSNESSTEGSTESDITPNTNTVAPITGTRKDDNRDIDRGGSPGGLDWLNAKSVDEPIDYYEEEPITLNEIFAGLAIPYCINPETFTQESMDSYLESMGTDYKAIDLWDDFMYYLKKQ